MNRTDLPGITQTLANVANGLRAERMIYQAQAKREAAYANGVSPEAYFRLPFAEWVKIRDARRS